MKTTTDIVNAVLDEFFDGTEEDKHPRLAAALAVDSEYDKLRALLAEAVVLARQPVTVLSGGSERPLADVLIQEAGHAETWKDEVLNPSPDDEALDQAAVAHNLGRFAETMRTAAAALTPPPAEEAIEHAA